ncbi:unnamed protein product [Rotaria socialis]|uniref:Uncharacterized protein n=2 Tax=Rotaria socialis TaxID=392032 RepID=A0A817XGS4_9BILA|nr:unnamed protein product [Rotaria socialis]CAF3617933.1 unnamed protein product [Rotaria socialis]
MKSILYPIRFRHESTRILSYYRNHSPGSSKNYEIIQKIDTKVIDADNLSDLLNEISEHSVDELFKKKK